MKRINLWAMCARIRMRPIMIVSTCWMAHRLAQLWTLLIWDYISLVILMSKVYTVNFWLQCHFLYASGNLLFCLPLSLSGYVVQKPEFFLLHPRIRTRRQACRDVERRSQNDIRGCYLGNHGTSSMLPWPRSCINYVPCNNDPAEVWKKLTAGHMNYLVWKKR